MSVRASTGANLAIAQGPAPSGGAAFMLAVWVKFISDVNHFADLFTLAADALDSATFLQIATDTDGTSLAMFSSAFGASTPANYASTTGTWYWCALGFTAAGGDMVLRVFGDTTSTTPLATLTVTTPSIGGLSVCDNTIIAKAYTGDDADAEFENAKIHLGVYWTDAQARTESQNYDIQTAGGTKWGSWRLKTTAATIDGINDNSGNARNLTNTSCTNGASTPVQLGGGGGFTAKFKKTRSGIGTKVGSKQVVG